MPLPNYPNTTYTIVEPNVGAVTVEIRIDNIDGADFDQAQFLGDVRDLLDALTPFNQSVGALSVVTSTPV